jgi:hypothetical protein
MTSRIRKTRREPHLSNLISVRAMDLIYGSYLRRCHQQSFGHGCYALVTDVHDVTGLIHGPAAGADASCIYFESFSFSLSLYRRIHAHRSPLLPYRNSPIANMGRAVCGCVDYNTERKKEKDFRYIQETSAPVTVSLYLVCNSSQIF